jgi:signal transduction histidine kinase
LDIAKLRGIIAHLRPADINQLGIDGAINGLAEHFAGKGLAVDVSVEVPSRRQGAGGRDALDLETTIYRIVQEALTNATKHGEARRAVVEITERGPAIHLTVRDDGGFDPAVKKTGFGLSGMRERAKLLGGTLVVHSAPGQVTTIEAAFQVARQDQDAPSSGHPARQTRGHRAGS